MSELAACFISAIRKNETSNRQSGGSKVTTISLRIIDRHAGLEDRERWHTCTIFHAAVFRKVGTVIFRLENAYNLSQPPVPLRESRSLIRERTWALELIFPLGIAR